MRMYRRLPLLRRAGRRERIWRQGRSDLHPEGVYKMKASKPGILILPGVLLILSLACSLFFPASPTASIITTLTPLLAATLTPVPLHQQVTLSSAHFEESGQSPNYTITSETPTLTG